MFQQYSPVLHTNSIFIIFSTRGPTTAIQVSGLILRCPLTKCRKQLRGYPSLFLSIISVQSSNMKNMIPFPFYLHTFAYIRTVIATEIFFTFCVKMKRKCINIQKVSGIDSKSIINKLFKKLFNKSVKFDTFKMTIQLNTQLSYGVEWSILGDLFWKKQECSALLGASIFLDRSTMAKIFLAHGNISRNLWIFCRVSKRITKILNAFD